MKNFYSSTQKVNTEKTIEVPDENNMLFVQLRSHTYVSICDKEKREIASEIGSNSEIGFYITPGTYIVQTDGEIEEITLNAVNRYSSLLEQVQESSSLLRLTSDAPDQHIVDGIGEVPADGTSFCTISIEKLSFDGTPLTTNEHQDELFIRTTGGIVMDEAGENHIRSLQLQSGQAKFRLVSEPSPKVVTVSVFGRNPQQKADIQIEFI